MNRSTLEKAASGDKVYQKEVFKSKYGRIHAISMRYAESEEEAKEFTENIFITIFNKLKSGDIPSNFEEWSRSIAVNYCCNEIIVRPGIISNKKENIDLHNKDIQTEVVIEMIRELPSKTRVFYNAVAIDALPVNEAAKMFCVDEDFLMKQVITAIIEIKHKVSHIFTE